VAWCRWLSDGELSESDYPDGTGYYENLGPAYAHTQYGETPAEMRQRLQSMTGVTAGARAARIRTFVDDLHNNFVNGKNGPSVVAFNSAVQIHRQLTGSSVVINPATMFTDPQLRSDFGVTAKRRGDDGDEREREPGALEEQPEHQRAGADDVRADDQGVVGRVSHREPRGARVRQPPRSPDHLEQEGPGRSDFRHEGEPVDAFEGAG